uniref:Pathogenesis-related protein 1B-like n=2 Tax=Elaeis guineensis var. tenera TaxID=51953 RepID=A0A6I9Q845_ELAGV|nr:pathogenesis-related protein 1B-like [Elaeis guineensis]
MVVAMAHSTLAQNSHQDYVDAHNKARQEEPGVGPVSWNYANKRKRDCYLEHSYGPYGENLFSGWGKEFTAADAVEAWVSEKDWYDYYTNTCDRRGVCEHYTQVVWRNSTQIGCARVKCPRGDVFITCNYYPPGNVPGERPFSKEALAWHAQ